LKIRIPPFEGGVRGMYLSAGLEIKTGKKQISAEVYPERSRRAGMT